MKALPILFQAPMVRAILAGAKWQTRRTRVLERFTARGEFMEMARNDDGVWCAVFRDSIPDDPAPIYVPSPFGQTGDRLWVKETWTTEKRHDALPPSELPTTSRLHFLADGPKPEWAGKTRVSIHMTRWASRIDLEVTGVRVERLISISEADAVAEGVERVRGRDVPAAMGGGVETWRDYLNAEGWVTNPVSSYRSLWESINGPGSWAANPWCWVVEFKRIEVDHG